MVTEGNKHEHTAHRMMLGRMNILFDKMIVYGTIKMKKMVISIMASDLICYLSCHRGDCQRLLKRDCFHHLKSLVNGWARIFWI